MQINHTANPRHIRLIPITDSDLPFLLKVYAGTRADEMALTGWKEDQIAEFLEMQFRMQHHSYTTQYHNSSLDKILYKGEEAGRFYVDRRDNEIRIIDIALLPEFRRKGIGGQLFKSVMEEAAQTGKSVSIHVEKFNPALQFYQKLGFHSVVDRGVYLFMEWLPENQLAEME